MNFLWCILIGIAAGFLAGLIMKGRGFGLIVNLFVGMIGGVLGGWLFGLFGISVSGGIWGSLLTATVGAIALLGLLSLFGGKK